MKVDALTVTHWSRPSEHLPIIRRRLVRRLRYHVDRKTRAGAKAYARARYEANKEQAKFNMRKRYAAVALLRAVLNIIEPRPGRAYVKADCPRAALIVRPPYVMTAVPSTVRLAALAAPAAPSV